jgi:putative N6-adenine-specific DNA methylase
MDSKMANFYLIIPPGLEKWAKKEFLEKFPLFFPELDIPELKIERGGINVYSEVRAICLLNKVLKIPSRILIRLDSFKCRDFPKLFKKIKKMPWNDYLLGTIPKIKITTQSSRIINTKRATQAVEDGIKEFYKAKTPKKAHLDLAATGVVPTIYLRIENDDCVVSVDTSGEHLHKRGYKTHSTRAPLRENFAAALLYALKEWSGVSGQLYDPMCGSASFLLESLSFYQLNDWRNFNYQYFPILEKEDLNLKDLDTPYYLFQKNRGGDLEAKAIEASKENASKLSLSKEMLTLTCEDFLKKSFTVKEELIIVNPPYGKRISQKIDGDPLIKQILDQAKSCCSHIGILLPAEQSKFLPRADQVLSFSNGGLDVVFSYFRFN